MGVLSSKLRSIRDGYGAVGFAHWCPGCEEVHVIWHTKGSEPGVFWKWNGDAENPTTDPSIKYSHTDYKDGKEVPGTTVVLCHYHLRSGKIAFCDDCAHALKGQTVPLPDWPPRLG